MHVKLAGHCRVDRQIPWHLDMHAAVTAADLPGICSTLVKTRSRPEDRNLERVTSQYAVERNAVNQAAKEHLASKA